MRSRIVPRAAREMKRFLREPGIGMPNTGFQLRPKDISIAPGDGMRVWAPYRTGKEDPISKRGKETARLREP